MPLVTSFPLSLPHSSRHLCPPALPPQVQLQAKSHAAVDHMGSDWLRLFEGDAMACTISSLRAGCTYRARVSAERGGAVHGMRYGVQLLARPCRALDLPSPSNAFFSSLPLQVRAASAAGAGLWSIPIDVASAPDAPDAPEPPTLEAAEAVRGGGAGESGWGGVGAREVGEGGEGDERHRCLPRDVMRRAWVGHIP